MPQNAMPSPDPPKSIKQQAEAWWDRPFIVDPLKPARWRIGWADELEYDRYPVVLDQDDGRPFGAQTAV
jgi:hypothetical protein